MMHGGTAVPVVVRLPVSNLVSFLHSVKESTTTSLREPIPHSQLLFLTILTINRSWTVVVSALVHHPLGFCMSEAGELTCIERPARTFLIRLAMKQGGAEHGIACLA